MSTHMKETLKKYLSSQLFWIQLCAIGIWVLVLQNIFGREDGSQRVYVDGGRIEAEVSGSVDANVSGSVDVDNTVDVNVRNTVMTW